MMMRLLMALGLLLGVSPAFAGPSDGCFHISQFQQWRAADNKTIYLRVDLSQYYRLDMSGACPLLTVPDAHLITKSRGSDLICSAIDWDISVSESSPGAIAMSCIVQSMTKLTPAEVAAIPPKFKP
jgi:hypothetical protein